MLGELIIKKMGNNEHKLAYYICRYNVYYKN